MNRRAVLVGLAATGVSPVSAWAQVARAPGKIGYVNQRTIDPIPTTLSVLRTSWRRLGHVGDDAILARSAEGDARRVPSLIAELAGQGAGVLIVVGAEAVKAASTATDAPIVAIDLETDPVRAGLAASFARPGGNVTGLFLDLPSLAGKWIELLQEFAPSLERIAIGWDSTTGSDQLDVATAVVRSKGIEAVVIETSATVNYDEQFGRLGGGRRTGVIHLSSPGFITVAPRFAAAAQKFRLPNIAFLKVYAKAGVLATYGPHQEEYFARAALIADKILKGERAGDIPIEQPTRFELVLNLKTARALGLEVPPTLLARADEVIE